MKEVKSPKKPLYYYYGIVLLVIVLVNLFLTPMLSRAQVTDVDYGTFMDMIEEQNIGSVEVDDTQILLRIRIILRYTERVSWKIPR